MISYLLSAVYALAGIYFLLLLAAFFLSFRKAASSRKDAGGSADRAGVSVVLLIDGLENYREEALRSVLEQCSDISGRGPELIFIDRGVSSDLIKELSYDYPNVRKMQFSTPQMNIRVIREILEHKSTGEIFVFVDSRSRVQDGWLDGLLSEMDEDLELLAAKTLSELDEERPRYFQALDRLFKTTLLRSLGPKGLSIYARFDNIVIRRQAFFGEQELPKLKRRTVGDQLPTTVLRYERNGFRALLADKLSENFWSNPMVERSAVNISWYFLNHAVNILPLLLFLLYLRGLADLLPMLIVLFMKFIGEGLIISRGARIYSQQPLLNDFWSWFFINPPISLIMFLGSVVIPIRFFRPKSRR